MSPLPPPPHHHHLSLSLSLCCMLCEYQGYPEGNLSKCLVNLKAGDTVLAKGPMPKFK